MRLLSSFSAVNPLSILHRHLPHSTSGIIKSELKVHKQLLKHYKSIEWDKHLLSSSRLVMFSISLRH